jgi:uncharacterized protein YegL
MPEMPMGDESIATRPLHFIWICDCSGSMAGDKIESLNDAIRQSLPVIKSTADSNPFAQVLMRCIKFSTGAEWVNEDPIPIENYIWNDLQADGVTDMGEALSMVADKLKIPPMDRRGFPPVLVLVSDGQPTDKYEIGLKKLMSEPWGKKSVRLSVGIGSGADTDVLEKFMGNPDIKPLVAKNSNELVRYMIFLSRTGTSSSIAPYSRKEGSQDTPVPRPLEDNWGVW